MEGELEDLATGRHTYAEYRIFGKHRIVLCDFCMVDFSSYKPAYFGLPETGKVIGSSSIEYVRDQPKPWVVTIDKYCLSCEQRLNFLTFRASILSENA